MKKSARSISLLAAALLTPMLLAGCMQANPNTIGAATGGGKASAVPVENSSTAPSTAPSKAPKLTPADTSKAASSENGGVKATEKHTAQQVQNAIYSAKLIMGALQSDKALLDGSWAKNNYAQDDLTRYGTFFTDDTFKGLLQDVYKKDTDATSRTNLLLLTSYFPESDGHYVLCPDKQGSCLVNGYPKYTNLRYSDDKAGGIDVYFDIENRYVTKLDGERGYIPVKNTIILNMVADPAYTKDSGSLPFIIDGWKGTYARGDFAK